MVKFQPRPNVKLTYPCCLYEQSNGKTEFANNRPYTFTKKYSLTYISRDPDDPNVERIAMAFPMIVMDRTFITDGLNHYAYTLYW